jgi:transposase
VQPTASDIDYKPLYEAAQTRVEKLEHELAQLKKWIFGAKHERFVPTDVNNSQLPLGIETEVVAACKVTDAKKVTYVKTTTETSFSRHPRMWLSKDLRREEIIIEPENTAGLKKIGEDVTEILEYRPGEFYVKRIVRPKYAKPGNSGVVMASLPERALEKHILGESVLAQIIVDKYADHLPLYRQNERFKRSGINIPSSTMSDAVRSVYNLIAPLGNAHLEEVLATRYLGADDTPIDVRDRNKKGTTHKGYFWVYYNSERKLVYFDYREGRGREGPVEILKDFLGYLQCDGHNAYDIFENRVGVILLACMAHARRMFIDALDNDEARAEHVLGEVQKLYAIEDEIKALSADQKKNIRQEKSTPILNSLHEWMKEQYMQSLAKQNDIVEGSLISKAICYSLKRWDRLTRYCEDGMLSIDNNPVERSIRPVKLGAKNYLFCGSHEAAKRSAMMYSLLGTCKLHGHNPLEYLTDVLKRLPSHPINRIKELLPQNWKK